MKEIWKTIDDYMGIYQVSNYGNVKSSINKKYLESGFKSIRKDKILKPGKTKSGYLFVRLCKNGICKTKYVHRLVAIAFIPNPENKPQINHKNGIKTDNRVNNLEWATPKENINHAWDNGRCTPHSCKGESSPATKLTNIDVINIKKKLLNHKKKDKTIKQIAMDYGISVGIIYKIKYGYTWRHINDR